MRTQKVPSSFWLKVPESLQLLYKVGTAFLDKGKICRQRMYQSEKKYSRVGTRYTKNKRRRKNNETENGEDKITHPC